MLEKKNGKKSMHNTLEIDDDARTCIRNFRVDAVVRSFDSSVEYILIVPLTESKCGVF